MIYNSKINKIYKKTTMKKVAMTILAALALNACTCTSTEKSTTAVDSTKTVTTSTVVVKDTIPLKKDTATIKIDTLRK